MSLTFEDLKDTILPFISIDEFEPKSGVTREIIVIAFYANEEGPMIDLNTFIQRGTFDILDTEVSPNPDENGRYLLFVELTRNNEFYDMFPKFIRDIENLTGPQEWKIKPYLANISYSIDSPEVYDYIITNPAEYKDKKRFNKEQNIKESFKDTSVLSLTFDHDNVIFTNTTDQIAAKLVEFGTGEYVSHTFQLKESSINFSPTTEIVLLDDMIGPDWNVFDLGRFVALENYKAEVLLLKDVQCMYGIKR